MLEHKLGVVAPEHRSCQSPRALARRLVDQATATQEIFGRAVRPFRVEVLVGGAWYVVDYPLDSWACNTTWEHQLGRKTAEMTKRRRRDVKGKPKCPGCTTKTPPARSCLENAPAVGIIGCLGVCAHIPGGLGRGGAPYGLGSRMAPPGTPGSAPPSQRWGERAAVGPALVQSTETLGVRRPQQYGGFYKQPRLAVNASQTAVAALTSLTSMPSPSKSLSSSLSACSPSVYCCSAARNRVA